MGRAKINKLSNRLKVTSGVALERTSFEDIWDPSARVTPLADPAVFVVIADT